MSLENLADLSYRKGDYEESKTYCRESLKIASKYKIVPLMLASFVSIARLLMKEEKNEDALRLLLLVRDHPAATAETKRDADTYASELQTALPASAFTAVMEKAKKERAEQVAEEIANALT
jgi:hypothetical protein